jgi:dienelactone hydrolase
MQILKTATGVRFGVLGVKPAKPAPAIFIFSSTIEESLGDVYFRQCGDILVTKGYLCVALDLPCHGLDKRHDEPFGLEGWRYRIDHNEPVIAEFTDRVSDVLSCLIDEGYTDCEKVAVCGTSRGGFLAAHVAAADSRIKCVAMFAPVVDIAMLQEFKNFKPRDVIPSAALVNVNDKLVGRDIWIVIGDQDTRVDTDSVIAFARAVSRVSGEKSRIELHVMPEPRGHTVPERSAQHAAAWIINLLGQGEDVSYMKKT